MFVVAIAAFRVLLYNSGVQTEVMEKPRGASVLRGFFLFHARARSQTLATGRPSRANFGDSSGFSASRQPSTAR